MDFDAFELSNNVHIGSRHGNVLYGMSPYNMSTPGDAGWTRIG